MSITQALAAAAAALVTGLSVNGAAQPIAAAAHGALERAGARVAHACSPLTIVVDRRGEQVTLQLSLD